MFNTSWHDKNWAFYISLQHKLDHLLTTSKSCPVVLFLLGTYTNTKKLSRTFFVTNSRGLKKDVLSITFRSRLQIMFISTEKTKDFVSNFRLFHADKTCIHSLLLSYQVSCNVDLLILILVVFNLSSFLNDKNWIQLEPISVFLKLTEWCDRFIFIVRRVVSFQHSVRTTWLVYSILKSSVGCFFKLASISLSMRTILTLTELEFLKWRSK